MKDPEGDSVDSAIVSQIFSQLFWQQASYSTCAMYRDFLNKHSWVANVSKMLLKIFTTIFCRIDLVLSMYLIHKWMNVWQRPSYRYMKQITIPDLKRANGNPHCGIFDKFWQELQMYLDKTTLAVIEIRHGDFMHMPLAVSIHHVQELIAERLKKKVSCFHT